MRLLRWLPILFLWGINIVECCPDNCKCGQATSPERTEVNCHKRGLTAFPSNLPMDTWILKMGKKCVFNSKDTRSSSNRHRLAINEIRCIHHCLSCNCPHDTNTIFDSLYILSLVQVKYQVLFYLFPRRKSFGSRATKCFEYDTKY